MEGKDPKTGRFLPHNKFWEARSSHGANPKFEGPEQLYDACLQYFNWNDANPLYEDTVRSFEGSHEHVPVAKMRAMTLIGLCLYIDVSVDRWQAWRKERPDLHGVMQWAENCIKKQKFEGASAGLLSHNIIARDLGLVDKMQSQMQMLDKDGQPTDPAGTGVMEVLGAVLDKIAAKE